MSEDLGQVILPVMDSTLRELGFDVKSLGLKALGVVVEAARSRSHVLFPELSLKIWLSPTEYVPLGQLTHSHPDFLREAHKMDVSLYAELFKIFPVIQFLNADERLLSEMFAGEQEILQRHFTGIDQNCRMFSLGVEELFLDDLNRARDLLGYRLLFARFLPSGMHKLDLSFYLATPPKT